MNKSLAKPRTMDYYRWDKNRQRMLIYLILEQETIELLGEWDDSIPYLVRDNMSTRKRWWEQ